MCRARFTRLNQDGTVADGPHNSYVTDAIQDLAYNPVVVAGAERDLEGGCDCLIATFKGRDKHKRFDLSMHIGKFEPALLEMLTGSGLISDDSTIPVPMGVNFPTTNTLDCSAAPVRVAVEAWADIIDGDHEASSPFRYARVVFPASEWRMDNNTMQNDFQPLALTGFSRGNSNWADPYSDMPLGRNVGAGGGIIYDDTIPTANCGYSTTDAASS